MISPRCAARATLDGDEWVINGQKIWTTQGFHADYAFLLCRTDPDAPRHKAISYLLCPMHQPGVEVRRIKQIDGGAEFCEVFFTDARCPRDNVVGGVNEGLEGRDDHAWLRARYLRHHRLPPLRERARRDHRDARPPTVRRRIH